MTKQIAKNVVEQIMRELDKTFLLGAALDCMSDDDIKVFEKKIEKIVEAAA